MNDMLNALLQDKLVAIQEAFGETTIEVKAEHLLEAAQKLRENEASKFEFLSDLTGVDCGGGQFEVVYHLLSIVHRKRLRLKVKAAGGQELPSVVTIWPTANWHERESFDLLGIVFKGHPDLKRILTPEGFTGHPLRKEYPLRGEN
jgi:NADH-quinone oxidoreductase subunit C